MGLSHAIPNLSIADIPCSGADFLRLILDLDAEPLKVTIASVILRLVTIFGQNILYR